MSAVIQIHLHVNLYLGKTEADKEFVDYSNTSTC